MCEGNCCVVKETHSHRYYTLLSTLIQWHFSVQQLDWSTWRYHTVDSLRLIIKCPVISLLACSSLALYFIPSCVLLCVFVVLSLSFLTFPVLVTSRRQSSTRAHNKYLSYSILFLNVELRVGFGRLQHQFIQLADLILLEMADFLLGQVGSKLDWPSSWLQHLTLQRALVNLQDKVCIASQSGLPTQTAHQTCQTGCCFQPDRQLHLMWQWQTRNAIHCFFIRTCSIFSTD